MSGPIDQAPKHILIGMPSHRGIVATPTLVSLLHLQQALILQKIVTNFLNIDYAEVGHSRNIIANMMLMNKDYSHLLFVDDDMSFEPSLINELIQWDRPIAGAICPKRTISLEKFFEIASSGGSFEQARAEAVSFVTRFASYSKFEVKNGWVPLDGIGMGITLIKRHVFEDMVAKGSVPDRWAGKDDSDDRSTEESQRFGFFDGIYDNEQKSMLSEDLSFCFRWRNACQGEIWGNANFEIGHIGQMTFTGRYVDRLRMGKL